MTTAMVTTNGNGMAHAHAAPVDAVTMETVIGGNLAPLTPGQRVAYYAKVCESVGLNPLTKPFDYLLLNGKVVLYTTKNCTDQLRSLRAVSITIVGTEVDGDILTVTAEASMPDGRKDSDIGAVTIKGKSGDDLANARMKAVTKAKRRVTLSICGLSMLDESEIETVKGARRVEVDAATGEIVEAPRGLAAEMIADGTLDAAQQAASAAQQAKKRVEDDALAAEYAAMVEKMATDRDLLNFCQFNAWDLRNMSPNPKKRLWRILLAKGKELGVSDTEMRDEISNGQPPSTDESEAAE